jgi:hypothetical protein
MDGGKLTDAIEFGNARRLMDWQDRYRDGSWFPKRVWQALRRKIYASM